MITPWPLPLPAGPCFSPTSPDRQDGRMDSTPLQIPLGRLRHILAPAVQHIEASAGSTVALGRDCFWSVPDVELHDVPDEPRTITTGRLSESWQHVEERRSRTGAPAVCPLMPHELVRPL